MPEAKYKLCPVMTLDGATARDNAVAGEPAQGLAHNQISPDLTALFLLLENCGQNRAIYNQI